MNLQKNVQNSAKLACLMLLLCQSSQVLSQPPLPISPASSPNTPNGLAVIRNTDGLLVTDNGSPVFQYQLSLKSRQQKWPRNNYIHPLYNLAGEIITEDFPDDHGHHRGIFWAWHQVYVDDVRLGDSWLCRDFQWDVQSSSFTGPHQKPQPDRPTVQLTANIHWKSPSHTDPDGKAIAVIDEHTTITVHSAAADHRRIDFDIRLKALVPGVRIGGSEDKNGYGGFSPRIKLSPGQTFTSSHGKIEPTRNSILAGAWINIADEHWGMAILTHPSNPGFPQPWILRRSRSMQNAVYPGPQPTPISKETVTQLRYSLIVHGGQNHQPNIDDVQRHYVQDSVRSISRTPGPPQ